jgi:CBS-domain-containing membrane protein
LPPVEKLIARLGLTDRLRAGNPGRYIMQCGLATGVVLTLLLILDAFTQTVLIAALGASTFIAFAVPRSLHSDPRHMIGGYLVGIFAGGLLGLLNDAVLFTDPANDHALMVVLGALATGLAMFLMVITKTEHPPAAALALGLVLNPWDWQTLMFIVGGIVVLTFVKQLVMPLLMDLL